MTAGQHVPAEALLGSCFDLLPEQPDAKFDLILMDPPFQTTDLAFDAVAVDWPRWWAEANRVLKPEGVVVAFASDLFTVRLIQTNMQDYRYRLVWHKTMPVGFLDANIRPLRAHEDILIFARKYKASTYNPQKTPGTPYTARRDETSRAEHYNKPRTATTNESGDRHPTSVLKFANGGNNSKHHPTQKPVELLRWLISTYSNPGDLVLDPFMGSGSTLVAAAGLGRPSVGMEIDPKYHARAVTRLQHTVPNLLGMGLEPPLFPDEAELDSA